MVPNANKCVLLRFVRNAFRNSGKLLLTCFRHASNADNGNKNVTKDRRVRFAKRIICRVNIATRLLQSILISTRCAAKRLLTRK